MKKFDYDTYMHAMLKPNTSSDKKLNNFLEGVGRPSGSTSPGENLNKFMEGVGRLGSTLSIEQKIDQYIKHLNFFDRGVGFLESSYATNCKYVSKCIGNCFHKRVVVDRNIYFGPFFNMSSKIRKMCINIEDIYLSTKKNYFNALPDFFVMLYENNDNNLDCIVDLYVRHIFNKETVKFKIDYSTCSESDIYRLENEYKRKNNIIYFFNRLLKIAEANQTNLVPNRISPALFKQYFCNSQCNDQLMIRVNKKIEQLQQIDDCCNIL
jgi:hypothetical protein